jgi:two-component system, chemotaxis family, protein-glutamate methylesterase/glutaminase
VGTRNGHDIVVVGASAGGVEALGRLAKGLPPGLGAAVFVVLHITPDAASALPDILSRAGSLPALHPVDGQRIEPGRIYVAPPDRHLLIWGGRVHVARGPRENGHRPAVDPLFRTAARSFGPRVVGVVLSGTLDDGTAGLSAIKTRGGVAIVQDPDEALFPGMPRSAVDNVRVDHVLPIDEIASCVVSLVNEPATGSAPAVSHDMEMEARMAELEGDAVQSDDRPGVPSVFGCPDCGGVLWELGESELIRYRCRVGHAYSPDTLSTKQLEAIEDALWMALRALEEQAALARRLAHRAEERGQRTLATRFQVRQRDAQDQAAVIREVLANGRALGESAQQANG